MNIIQVSEYRKIIAKNRSKGLKSAKNNHKVNISYDIFPLQIKAKFNLTCIPEFKFHPTRKWRFDFAIPQIKMAIEVEGGIYTRGRHLRPTGFLRDMEKYNTASLMGWTLFRTTPKYLNSVYTYNAVESCQKITKTLKNP